MLIFLPEFFASAQGFEARMARVHETAYRLRAWAYLLHPFIVLTAALGIAFAIRQRSPVLALIGLARLHWWAFTEASQQTLTLFAFDRWRVAYAAADEATRAAIRINTVMYDGIWDGMYMLLLIAFAIGNACYGAALLSSAVGWRAWWADSCSRPACSPSACSSMNSGSRCCPAPVLEWSYPAIQPLGRLLIGVWLWRAAAAHLRGAANVTDP